MKSFSPHAPIKSVTDSTAGNPPRFLNDQPWIFAGGATKTQPCFTWQMHKAELRQLKRRQIKATFFRLVCLYSMLATLAVLGILVFEIVLSGYHWLDWQFLTSYPSRFVEQAGIRSGLVGSFWLLLLTLAFAVPIGIGAGVYVEEFMPKGKFRRILELNIANLAGVPSIVYGILGLAIFVRFLHFDRSVLSAGLTLSILVLPTVIIATQEALKMIPNTLRQASLSLGASKWQTVKDHVLPNAAPGIFTGVILATSRAIGETAPLVLIGGVTYIAFSPENIFDAFTALPIQIFNWASRPQEEFHAVAAAGILVLLALLLSANAVAIYLRARMQRKNICQLL